LPHLYIELMPSDIAILWYSKVLSFWWFG